MNSGERPGPPWNGSKQLQRLRLLSYNIQAGVDTRHYRQYVTQSWKQVLPHRERLANLNRIASMVARYDVVALQEVDSGSLRTGFLDQTEYLAYRAEFPHWYSQVNRKLGKLAQHSNGLLSRVRPYSIVDYKLPGLPGRGAMVVEFGSGQQQLMVCVMHLALGRRGQERQLAFISELVAHYPHLVLMGDFNCDCASPSLQLLVQKAKLREPSCEHKTFPSWRPRRNLDHILVSSTLSVANAEVLDYAFSDHLPVSVEIVLPESVRLAA
jgi:endonuclease/exonuclease/phosphatase family metal-dependent hydrolase